MSVGRRHRFLLLLMPLFATGCGPLFGTPTIWPPESQKTQVARASKFDPFPDPNMGPAVIGGRPQGFLNPRPEPDPNKTVRADWFNPALALATRLRCIIRALPQLIHHRRRRFTPIPPALRSLHRRAFRPRRRRSFIPRRFLRQWRRPSHRSHPRRQPRRRLLTARRSIPPDRAGSAEL